jgi:alpha-1,3-rhamnosyl/mannosyltransferase
MHACGVRVKRAFAHHPSQNYDGRVPDVLVDLTPLRTSSRFRGIGQYARCLARALDALSAEERSGLTIGALTDVAGEHALGSLDWDGESPEGEFHHLRWLMQRRIRLPRTLWRLRPRLFHVTEPLGTPRGSFVPRVATCHDLLKHVLHRDYLPGRPVYRRVLQLADMTRFHSARRVIAISRFTADSLMRLLGVAAARIDVVPHGVDHQRFSPARDAAEELVRRHRREALGVRDRPYLLYVGGADPRKSIATLIGALDRTRDLELVLVGRYGVEEQAIVDAAVARAKSSVRALGFVTGDDLVALLDGARALAFPSIGEGFGLPVLEAMAVGCPVITTGATALAEVAGDAAILVAPRDERALADAILRVATDDALRGDLTRAGIARAAAFTWHKTALLTIQTYVHALA